MESAEKTKADWESIETFYRAGVLSLREIAKQHGVSDGAIRKKAKQFDWQRDLTARVAEKVRTDLVRSEVRTPCARTEREIVDGAAAMVVQVVREHRRDIAGGREIASLLMAQLHDVAGKRNEFEDGIEAECAVDKTNERRNKLMRAVSIPAHAATLRDLSHAMKNLVGLERQAFNISDAPEPASQEPSTAEQVSAGFDDLRAAFAKRLGNAGPA